MKAKSVLLLLTPFMLASCVNAEIIGSSKKEESSSSSKVEGSESSSSSSENEVNPTAWTAEDLQTMSAFIGDYVIPFPEGFTASYGVGQDEDGTAFAAWDETVSDLSTSYGNQLLRSGFTYEEESSDPENSLGFGAYRLYSNATAFEDGTPLLVQTQYADGEGFTLFAYPGATGSETFPYEAIAEYFGLSSLDASAIPSFDVAEGALYYGEEYDTGVYDVYGEVAGTEDEAIAAYEKSLTDLGYTLTSAEDSETGLAYGVSTDLGFQISYSYYGGNFDLYIQQYSGSGGALPEIPLGTKAISFSSADFGGKYSETETPLSKDSLDFGYVDIMSTGGAIQFSSGKKRTEGRFYNKSSLGEIASVVVTAQSADYYGVLSCYFSDAEITDLSALKPVTAHAQSSTVYCYVPEEGKASHFYLADLDESYASKNLSIVVNYTL